MGNTAEPEQGLVGNHIVPKTLQIRTHTWKKKSIGLFDYSYQDLNTMNMEIEDPRCFYIIQNPDDKITTTKKRPKRESGSIPLACVLYYERDYYIYQPYGLREISRNISEEKSKKESLDVIAKSSKLAWIITGQSNNKLNNEFKCGDYLKFGRVAFKVKMTSNQETFEHSIIPKEDAMNTSEGGLLLNKSANVSMRRNSGDALNQSLRQTDNSRLELPSYDVSGRESGLQTQRSKNKLTCRICWSEGITNLKNEDEVDDLLVSPCSCTGTVQYVHLSCLRNWLDSKLHTRETWCVNSYYWKNIECELCKNIFPDTVQIETQKYELKSFRILNYNIPENSHYVVLETYSSKKSKARIIHVIDFGHEDTVYVGRGQEANVRITDISVSRRHSELSCIDGKFYVCDYDSKFGTLRSFDMPMKIQGYVRLQSSKTVIILKIKKIQKGCICCRKRKKPRIYSIQDYTILHKWFPKELKKIFKIDESPKRKRRKKIQKELEKVILEEAKIGTHLPEQFGQDSEHVITEIADNDSERDEDNFMIEIPQQRLVNNSMQPLYRQQAWNDSNHSRHSSINEERKELPSRREIMEVERLSKNWELNRKQIEDSDDEESPNHQVLHSRTIKNRLIKLENEESKNHHLRHQEYLSEELNFSNSQINLLNLPRPHNPNPSNSPVHRQNVLLEQEALARPSVSQQNIYKK
ncbi:unnamed protein product [Moneuplotes crassus]|uniref:Uncharacterized protein n=1 Tax=Euplotes crassus TaxID=5936 RepID=A0AAD1Y5G6_EUPCR|nr:unnamed protein product [Moneuplotes crassus]